MKFKRMLCTVLCMLCLFSNLTTAHASDEKPDVEAKAAILLELNSGTVLYEKNADEKIYPASMTKIMTCLIALENSALNETVIVSETAYDGLGDFSSSAGLHPGEEIPMESLLYCMMISSANEACNVAAEHIFGSVEACVEKMNARALELGCTGTHFANTHGLHDEEHYTTARDMALITAEAMKNNTFRAIVGTVTYKMPATNSSGERTLTTTNQMMRASASNPYYDKRVTGVKTGFTTPAGRCLAATAENGDLSLLSVVGGCETRILESGDLEFASFPETEKLLEYGFNNYTYQTVLTTLYPLTQIRVRHSAGADHVSLAPAEEISALLPGDYSEDDLVVTAVPFSEEGKDGVEAPIAPGQELGTVTISYRGQPVGSAKLVAITGVERINFFKTGLGIGVWILLTLLLCAAILTAVYVARQKKRVKNLRNNLRMR